MAIFAVAGAHYYIGTTAAVDFTSPSTALTGFLADTYTEVSPVETIGDFGDVATDVKFLGINNQRAQHLKGSKDAGNQQIVAGFDATNAGQAAMKAAFLSPNDYNFKIAFNDAPSVRSATVTMTIAAPGVVTMTGHGLASGAAVSLATTGALPTGLVVATTYYVVPIDANTFSLSATKGGSAITTTGTQSGTHTLSTVPNPTTVYYRGKVMDFKRVMGTGPDQVIKLQCNVGINTDQIEVASAE